MEVMLKTDVKGLGKKGDRVTVSDGYARNFLFPRSLAVAMSAQIVTELKNKEAAEVHKMQEELRLAREFGEKLDGKTVKVSAKAGQNGKLFGSVTSKEIALQIKEQFGTDIDKRKIVVEDIKAFGTYTAQIKIHHEVSVSLYVVVGE